MDTSLYKDFVDNVKQPKMDKSNIYEVKKEELPTSTTPPSTEDLYPVGDIRSRKIQNRIIDLLKQDTNSLFSEFIKKIEGSSQPACPSSDSSSAPAPTPVPDSTTRPLPTYNKNKDLSDEERRILSKSPSWVKEVYVKYRDDLGVLKYDPNMSEGDRYEKRAFFDYIVLWFDATLDYYNIDLPFNFNDAKNTIIP